MSRGGESPSVKGKSGSSSSVIRKYGKEECTKKARLIRGGEGGKNNPQGKKKISERNNRSRERAPYPNLKILS